MKKASVHVMGIPLNSEIIVPRGRNKFLPTSIRYKISSTGFYINILSEWKNAYHGKTYYELFQLNPFQ